MLFFLTSSKLLSSCISPISPWAETPKIGFFVPIGGTSAIMDFLNLHLLIFMKIHDINTESVAFLVKCAES